MSLKTPTTAAVAGSATASLPRVGMVATVRNRRGVLSSVRPFSSSDSDGVLHLVDVEYNDGEVPFEESLIWEREPFARLLPPSALPDVASEPPMRHDDFLALVRACRWSARTPYIDPDRQGPAPRLPVTAPFHGAVQVEGFQLVPLLKALRMPRVSLLIADDVGLGKTIEAGLILSELLLRRRIRKVLVATPASLQVQWRDEMWSKFALPFEVVDRDSTARLRREVGTDANPWRSHARVITSYYYLKQPDVLEAFRAASRVDQAGAQLPWDMLIVDEAHNLTPPPFGEESDLCRMLRQIAPFFEHKLFLTATPHNGYTRSFTGLLELLDPVRFSQADEVHDSEKRRLPEVCVRRLKRHINAASPAKLFCDRLPPQAMLLQLSPAEKRLSDAFDAFRKALRGLVQDAGGKRRLAGSFAIEILGKRLLSCPVAFADSWHRCRAGMRQAESSASDQEVLTSGRSLREEAADDREATSLGHAAAATIGAWLIPYVDKLATEMTALDQALSQLGLVSVVQQQVKERSATVPAADSRWQALVRLISERLRPDGEWSDYERLVVFTEYKTTLDYLVSRLREEWRDEPQRFLSLYGGMDNAQREDVKRAFNDAANRVRVLVATDAASEGLNLQETARYLLHFDVPWNPARLEQRNGRLDRHGQARDVQTWHFVCPEDQDLTFLDLVVNKVHTIREDLGAAGEVFDELAFRRLVEGEDLATVRHDIDTRVDRALALSQSSTDGASDRTATLGTDDPTGDLATIAAELDYDPVALRQTLDAAMAIRAGRPRVTEPDPDGRAALVQPHPPAWGPVIDDSLRTPSAAGVLGALRRLAFDPTALVVKVGGRPVFRPRADTALMHLAHPMLQRALSSLTRLRFPGSGDTVASRWTVGRAKLPPGVEACVHLTVEEMGVNELRETFHHWVRTVRFPVVGGKLGTPLPHLRALDLRRQNAPVGDADVERARELWLDLEGAVRTWLRETAAALTKGLADQVGADRETALRSAQGGFQSRHGEVSQLILGNTSTKLERLIAELRDLKRQGLLFDQDRQFDALDREIEAKKEELERRRRHYEALREQLAAERERVIGLIPKRFSLRGDAQALPVAVEVLFPDTEA